MTGMAIPGEQSEYKSADPIGAANNANHDEPVASDSEIEYEEEQDVVDEEKNGETARQGGKRPAAAENALKAIATNTSAATGRSESQVEPKKPWYKKANPLKWGKAPIPPEARTPSREYKAGFFSQMTFQWMAPLMSVGYRRTLEQNDIWLVNPKRGVSPMTAKLEASFKKRAARGDKHPLVFAIYETFFWEFWLGGLCQLAANIFQVVSPFTLRYLIQFANDAYIAQINGTAPPHIGVGLGLVLGVTGMQILQSLGTNHFIYRGMTVGGEARAVLITLIFEKSMRISVRAKAGGRAITEGENAPTGGEEATDEKQSKKNKKRGKKTGKKEAPEERKGILGDGTGWSNGRVMNLMSVDTYRVDQASGMFHLLWTAPIACLITLVVLVINLHESALAGFALLVVGIPALTRAVKILFGMRKAINKISDQRVSLTQEILSGVRFVKYFGWESSFLERLGEMRNREIHAIQVLLAIRNAINAVSMSLPIFSSMLSFITYSLTDNSLNPAEVFSSLALFNSLRMPLNLLPLVIGQVVDASSSIKRIQEYLLCEEQEEEAIHKPDGKYAVEMNNASFTWERTATQHNNAMQAMKKPETKASKKAKNNGEEQLTTGQVSPDSASTLIEEKPPFQLHDLNFKVARNELIAVIGGVGAGKSSLLAALAGDMRKTSGEVVLGADRAFCPQYAWIQNSTVRDNILFDQPMDRDWYKTVVDACALAPDLDMLPNGDATEIGERGITISGGQKQRLNIARAIYFNAEIVIMDDPLSAVDAHVGRHIFDKAIAGLLKDKCRILATHQLWVLNRCDRIIWLDEGRIQAIDTFENLMADNPAFRQLMETTAVEEEREEKAQVNEDEIEEEKKSVKKKKKSATLMQAEERAVKSVPWEVYAAYVRASGTMFNAAIVIGLLLLGQGANIATSLWLSYWTSDKFGLNTGQYIGVYAGLGAVQALIMFFFSLSLTLVGTTASKVMLNRAITRTLRAPMSFFDTTPLGRITNRFSRDVDTMDNNLTDAMRLYFLTLAMISAVFILIIAYFHYFAIALVPLFFLFLFSAGYYRASAREMKRFEAVLRSNVFARFSEGLVGAACIKAYGLQNRFITRLRQTIDDMDSAYFLTFANQRWLSVRLDAIGNLLVFTTGILVVTSRFDVSPSIAGLVLSYILAIVQMLQFTIRQLAEVENGMNSTERIHYYGTELEEEAPLHTIDVRPSWPERGEIIFDNVQMRYREGLPLVLKGLTMHVRGGERIGVVGRTGAGKSSIMSTLFRLVELSGGSITIDGLNISTIGLHDLRSRLAIIPQDPTLFRGTIRSNLDPFGEHTDLELWSALRQSDLVSAETSEDEKQQSGRIHLDSVVEEEGLNFSLGQRQLMALARALVRGSQIIVCDEATSSVDMETDDKIQRTMAEGFKGKTMLCIAHRLRTIIGYDRICVMDQGRIAELDTPVALWEQGGIFRSMCERSGIRREDFDDYFARGHTEAEKKEEAA